MSSEASGRKPLRDISGEYRDLYTKVMESNDKERISFMLVFYDWINDFMKEAVDENERAFVIRSAFAIAKRLLESKLDGTRLVKIGQMVDELRSLRGDRDALFIVEHLKLQLFEDCGIDSEKPDWELVDKYLNYWMEASGKEEVAITYYRRDENGEIVTDNERVTSAGPRFFKHCSAECVEWFYSMELKPINYTAESLMELDKIIDAHWPRELFKEISIGSEEPQSIILLRLVLMTGSYLGEVLVRNLGGKWEKTEDLGWHIRLEDRRINVFNIAENSFRESSNFYNTFKLLENIKQ
ncbi:MAG: hypothetical protein QXN75_04220 [Thermoproteota archaeon]|nr:hypothetical protein [Candidatus Brockarchaeota archaeon]